MSVDATIRQTHLRWAAELCPAGAHALAVEERDVPQSPQALRGSIIHEVLARYVLHLYEQNRATDYDALVEIAENLLSERQGVPVDVALDVFEQVKRAGADFFFDREHFYGVEEALSAVVTTPRGLEVAITGIIDLLHFDGELAHLQDWKSAWAIASDSSVLDDFQLKLYAWLVWKNLEGVEGVEGSLFFTRYGITVPQKGTPAFWTPDDLRLFESALSGVLEDLFVTHAAQRVFVPGTHCQYCPRRKPGDCAHWKRYRGTEPPPLRTFYQARKAANRVVAIEQEREVLVDRLKDYVNSNGPITLGQTSKAETFGFFARESLEIKPSQVQALFDEFGDELGKLDVDKLFSVNARALKKFFSHAEFRRRYEELAKRKVATSFKHERGDA